MVGNMRAPRVKHIARMSVPRVSSSGVEYTHYLPLSLTKDQAVALSEWFESDKSVPDMPKTELIRAAIFDMVLSGTSEEKIASVSERWRTIQSLSESFSKPQVDKARSFLGSELAIKEFLCKECPLKNPPAQTTARREYVPPADYYRSNRGGTK